MKIRFPYNKNLNALCLFTLVISGQPFYLYNRNNFVRANFFTTTNLDTFQMNILLFVSRTFPNYLSIFVTSTHFWLWQYLFYFKSYGSNTSNSLANCNLWQSTYCCLDSHHIFNVVSIAVLTIFLILSTVSTFVFESDVNIYASARTKVFLSLEIPISSSKSSGAHSAISPYVSKIPSVASLSLFSDLTNAAMATVIFSSIFACELSSSLWKLFWIMSRLSCIFSSLTFSFFATVFCCLKFTLFRRKKHLFLAYVHFLFQFLDIIILHNCLILIFLLFFCISGAF